MPVVWIVAVVACGLAVLVASLGSHRLRTGAEALEAHRRDLVALRSAAAALGTDVAAVRARLSRTSGGSLPQGSR